jgi:hypothetical protein
MDRKMLIPCRRNSPTLSACVTGRIEPPKPMVITPARYVLLPVATLDRLHRQSDAMQYLPRRLAGRKGLEARARWRVFIPAGFIDVALIREMGGEPVSKPAS